MAQLPQEFLTRMQEMLGDEFDAFLTSRKRHSEFNKFQSACAEHYRNSKEKCIFRSRCS